MVGTGPLNWNSSTESVHKPRVTSPLNPMDLPDAIKFETTLSDTPSEPLVTDAMETLEYDGSATTSLNLYTDSEVGSSYRVLEDSIFARSMNGHFDSNPLQSMVADLTDYDTAKLASVFEKAGAHSAAHLLLNKDMENQHLTSQVYQSVQTNSIFNSDDLLNPEPQTTDQPYLNMIKRFSQFSPDMAKADLKLLQQSLLKAQADLEKTGQINANQFDQSLLKEYGLAVENNLLVILDDEQGSLKLPLSEVPKLIDSLDIMINAEAPLERILIAKAHALEQKEKLENQTSELEIRTGELEQTIQSGDIIESALGELDESIQLLDSGNSREISNQIVSGASGSGVIATIMNENNMQVQQSEQGTSFWISDNEVKSDDFWGQLTSLITSQREQKQQEYDAHQKKENQLRLRVVNQTENVSIAYEGFTQAKQALDNTLHVERPNLSDRERQLVNKNLIPLMVKEMQATEKRTVDVMNQAIMAFFGTDVNGIATQQFLDYMNDQMKADQAQIKENFTQIVEEISEELPEFESNNPDIDTNTNEEYQQHIDEWAEKNKQAFEQKITRRAKRRIEQQLVTQHLTQEKLTKDRDEQNQVVKNLAKDRERFIQENTIRENNQA